MNRKILAYFGGEKAISFKQPHWKWPPISRSKINCISKYYKSGEKKNSAGYPEIVKIFESNFAKYQKKKYALSTNSGTSALQAALFAVNIKPGDEIIAPALTFHATATPIYSVNGVPVLADCEPDTGNIDPESIEKKIGKKTKALIITHLCGHPCEMDKILKIIKKYKIFLIEDCSHAHGSTYKGIKVGNFGDIGCFSLDNNKLLAAGEGGILVTDNRKFFEKALLLSDFGPRIKNEIRFKNYKKYNETGLGFKHRIHPASAAIANNELKKINFYIKRRHRMLNYLSSEIKKIIGMSPPITRKFANRGAYYGYRPFYDRKKLNNISIDNFIKILQAEGMEVRRSSHSPLHLLPLFSKKKNGAYFLHKKYDRYKNYKNGDLPKCEKFYNSTLSLPTFTFEKKELVNQYIKAFKKVCHFLCKNKIKM